MIIKKFKIKTLIRKINRANGIIGFTVDQSIPGVIFPNISCKMIMPARTATDTGSLIMNIATRYTK